MMCAGYGRRGLGKYEAAFPENEINETVPHLTAQDLKETRCVAKRDFVAWSLASTLVPSYDPFKDALALDSWPLGGRSKLPPALAA